MDIFDDRLNMLKKLYYACESRITYLSKVRLNSLEKLSSELPAAEGYVRTWKGWKNWNSTSILVWYSEMMLMISSMKFAYLKCLFHFNWKTGQLQRFIEENWKQPKQPMVVRTYGSYINLQYFMWIHSYFLPFLNQFAAFSLCECSC